MLERDIQVRADVVAGGHDREQRIGDALRLQVHDAEPRVGKRFGQLVHEPGQIAISGKVLAPPPRILGDKIDLAGTIGPRALDFSIDVLEGEAVVASANGGNRAVGAEAVAAV